MTSSPSRISSKSVSRSDNAAADLLLVRERLLETLAVLHHFLAALGLIPEIRRTDLFFCFLQLGSFGGSVKDSSAQLQLAGGA